MLRKPILGMLCFLATLCQGAGYVLLDGEAVGSGVPGFGGGGGGSGSVLSVVAGANVSVDDTDSANPIVSSSVVGTGYPVTWTGEHDFWNGIGNEVTLDDTALAFSEFPLGGFKAYLTGTAAFTADREITPPSMIGTLALLDDVPVLTPLWELEGGEGSIAAVDRGTGYINAGCVYSLCFGLNNYISSSGDYSYILSGGHATLPNRITGGGYAIIAGGWDNRISSSTSGLLIGGGSGNELLSASSFGDRIWGGQDNLIQSGTRHSVIAGGQDNYVQGGLDYGMIMGGQDNEVISSYTGGIIGGKLNSLAANTSESVILGGYDNEVLNGGIRSIISGGKLNSLGEDYSAILGGNSNTTQEVYSLAAGHGSSVVEAGALVFSDSRAATTTSGGVDSATFNFLEGLDLVVVTTAPAAPAAGRVTFYCLRSGTAPNFTYDFTVKYSDNATDIISTHTVP